MDWADSKCLLCGSKGHVGGLGSGATPQKLYICLRAIRPHCTPEGPVLGVDVQGRTPAAVPPVMAFHTYGMPRQRSWQTCPQLACWSFGSGAHEHNRGISGKHTC